MENSRPDFHHLKTWPKYFKAIKNGVKKFEYRNFDRDFKVGDVLRLKEYDSDTKTYTGEVVDAKITYLLPIQGRHIDSCIMSIEMLTSFKE